MLVMSWQHRLPPHPPLPVPEHFWGPTHRPQQSIELLEVLSLTLVVARLDSLISIQSMCQFQIDACMQASMLLVPSQLIDQLASILQLC